MGATMIVVELFAVIVGLVLFAAVMSPEAEEMRQPVFARFLFAVNLVAVLILVFR